VLWAGGPPLWCGCRWRSNWKRSNTNSKLEIRISKQI
jgi:hypothetical protein